MQRINSARVGVAQGAVDLFSDFEEGGDMWTGEGSRSRSQWVAFDEAFSQPPAVHVSLTLWDMDSAHNVRADLRAENITEAGFEAVFRTWMDTRVARVRISWIAVGALAGEDDWDVV